MKVSVIIPTYNRKEYVVRAVGSVLAQTYQLFEILICDDGSTDGTAEAVAEIHDSRVRWIPGARNSGLPAVPRNRGIAESTGEWVAFLDSDDEWEPEKLETQMRIVEGNGAQAVCTNAYRAVSGERMQKFLIEHAPKRVVFSDLLHTNTVICSSVLMRRELLVLTGGFPKDTALRAAEDYALWLCLATETDIIFIDRPLLTYRDEPASSVRGVSADPYRTGMQQHIAALKYCISWCGARGGKERSVRDARRQIFSLHWDMMRYRLHGIRTACFKRSRRKKGK